LGTARETVVEVLEMINMTALVHLFLRQHPGWGLQSNSSFSSNVMTFTLHKDVNITYMEANNPEIVYGKLEAAFPRKKGPTATKTIRMHEPWFRSSRRRKK
jgi:hypothetical protein